MMDQGRAPGLGFRLGIRQRRVEVPAPVRPDQVGVDVVEEAAEQGRRGLARTGGSRAA